MTMVEIIAIIAAGTLCVLCVLCIVALLSNKRQAKESSRAIKDIENSLGTFSASIQKQTDQLIDHIEKQQFDELQAQRLDLLEQEVLRLSELEQRSIDAAKASDSIAETAGTVSAPSGVFQPQEAYSREPLDSEISGEYEGIEEIEEIEELDDEIELDDLFRELAAVNTVSEEDPSVLQQPQTPPPQQSAPQPTPPVQPVQPAAPIQIAQQPVQPVQQQPVQPVQPAPMMRPMPQPAPGGQGIHVSVIGQNAAHMPDAVRSAVARSATAPQANIFDKQGKAVPVMDNIEDILSSMGEDTSSMKKKEEEKVADIAYEEYKPRTRKSAPKKKAADKPAENARPLTAQELKEKKRRDKIDAQFKKDLAKKGF